MAGASFPVFAPGLPLRAVCDTAFNIVKTPSRACARDGYIAGFGRGLAAKSADKGRGRAGSSDFRGRSHVAALPDGLPGGG